MYSVHLTLDFALEGLRVFEDVFILFTHVSTVFTLRMRVVYSVFTTVFTVFTYEASIYCTSIYV